MRRREFLGGVLGVAVACSRRAGAEQLTPPLIGFLVVGSPEPYAARVRAFRQGLGEVGYAEGRNVLVEYRWTDGQPERLPDLAAEIVRRNVSAIVAGGTRSALAAKTATSTIPIVFYTVTSPIEAGLVASLKDPGGNLTGVTSLGVEVGPKRLELLHDMLPAARRLALLVNPRFPDADRQAAEMEVAARARGLELQVLRAASEADIDDAFRAMSRSGAAGLVITTDPFFTARMEQLATRALRERIPAISQYAEFAAAGGLASYGESFAEPYRQLGIYAGRILKGAKPADLPVEQATRFELVVNLKTAKALGLDVPPTLLARADEVIE